MTQIEFFSFADSRQMPYDHLVQVVRDAYRRGQQVFIHAENKQMANRIDEILWTQDSKSFLPHQLVGEDPRTTPPIEIGFGQKPGIRPDLLINLATEIPQFFSRFKIVYEYAWGDEETKQKARERYTWYKQGGYPMRHSQVPSSRQPQSN